jgi:hypothetical protein
VDQLIARKNVALNELDAERSQRRKEAHKRFVVGLDTELDGLYRQHAARMDEVRTRMAALEGTQFEKFFLAPAIRRDGDRIASVTRSATETARHSWRKQFFRERAEIDHDVRHRKRIPRKAVR